MSIKLNSIIFGLVLAAGAGLAQTNREAVINRVFDNDSLKGFDEAAAFKSVQQLPAAEIKVMMYRLKRTYINAKYNLKTLTTSALTQPAARTQAIAACLNEDFEQSAFGPIVSTNQVNGWTLTSGSNDPVVNVNANSCNLIGCCPGNPSASELINTSNGYIDPVIGPLYPIYSVFGLGSPNPLAAAANPQIGQSMSGSKIIRLNNNIANDYSIEKLSKTFSVTSDNALFQYAYISVFSGVGAHSCCESSAFQVKVSNAGNPIACPAFSITLPTLAETSIGYPGCSGNSDTPDYFVTGTMETYTAVAYPLTQGFNRWKISSIDLSAYIGQNITIDFIASDCFASGHPGYVYIDAQCGPMKLNVNGNTSVFNSNSINLSSCEQTAVITPPAGFTFYQWTSAAGLIADTTNVLTTSVSGTYTLTLGQTGLCQVDKIVTLNVVHIMASDSLLCEGTTGMLTAYGLTNCVWNTGQTGPSIAITPTQSGVYTVHGITPNGYSCASSIMQNVVGPCTGISKYTANDKGILVYPNPNNGEFTLNIKKHVQQAELLIENTLGQVLFTQPVSQGDTKVKTKNLAAGIYYYTVTENKIRIATGKMKVE